MAGTAMSSLGRGVVAARGTVAVNAGRAWLLGVAADLGHFAEHAGLQGALAVLRPHLWPGHDERTGGLLRWF